MRCGSDTYTRNTQYTYNSSSGAVTVYKSYLLDDIVITATSLQMFTVSFLNLDLTPAKDSIVVQKGYNLNPIGLPDNDKMPAYHTFASWKLTTDGTGAQYSSVNIYTVNADTTFYAYYTQSDENKVDEFVGVQLHFDVDVIDVSNTADTGACRGETGLYQVAKTAYNALSSSRKQKFCTEDKYENGRLRFIAWANANGEDLNLSTYAIVPLSARIISPLEGNNAVVVAIIISSVLTLSSIGLFFVIRRKRRLYK